MARLAAEAPLGRQEWEALVSTGHSGGDEADPGAAETLSARALIRTIGALCRSAEVAVINQDSKFGFVVDDSGAVCAVDFARGPGAQAVMELHPAMTDELLASGERRGAQWYIDRGWDPPFNAQQARLMGFDYVGNVIYEMPFPWIDRLGPRQAFGECSAYILRLNADAFPASVCRVDGDLRHVRAPSGPVAGAALSPRASRLLIQTETQIEIRDAKSAQLLVAISADGNWAEADWLDDEHFLLRADNDTPEIHSVQGARFSPKPCAGGELEIVRVRSAPGGHLPEVIDKTGKKFGFDGKSRCLNPS